MALRTFLKVVPTLEERIPISSAVAPGIIARLLPYLAIVYLSRQKDTYILRLFLLPIAIYSVLGAGFKYCYTAPEHNILNWLTAMCTFAVISKCLRLALMPEGALRVGETSLDERSSGLNPPCQPWLSALVEMALTARGFKFKYGQDIPLPKQAYRQDRDSFLKATGKMIVQSFFMLDLMDTLLKLCPGVAAPEGGTMFYADLPAGQRYGISTIIHIATGFLFLSGFKLGYQFFALIAVGVFRNSPADWPPVIDQPWISESMHELWAKRWHQLLRDSFYIYGGYIGGKIAGRGGLVLGMFLASGLFHELAMYSMRGGFYYEPVIFFAGQAIILWFERLWRTSTGRRVGGWTGRVWVYFVMVVLGQPMVDSWHRRGLGGGTVILPILSPTRRLISLFS
ncbi:hypothetical protein CPB85DRAFT_1376266 [Mucidula mucida]|nr:hypothetical protein CPB85DRAFT_1376266 [Mucidula mucida]